jgi:protein phosphatase
MGTTIVSLWVIQKRAFVGHVGDSRAYLVRETQLSQLTNDHSWVNEQQRKGTLSREQARTHPFRNVVTRALGGKEKVEVDLLELELKHGDLFLLCSDGLSSLVDDKTILETLVASRETLDETCGKLVSQANAHGGDDNATVILVEFRDEDATEVR